jgi:YVTN family beta-propeller protein
LLIAPVNQEERHNVKLKFLKCAVFAMAAAAGSSLAAPGMVYVADEGSDTVNVLDAESFRKVAMVAVGRDLTTSSFRRTASSRGSRPTANGARPDRR